MVWEPDWYKGQKGVVGHLLGAWKFSSIFSAQSGLPLEVNVGNDCQAYGEVNCSSGSTNENALLLSPYKGGNSVHGTGTSLNLFSNGSAEAGQFRPPLVGFDRSEEHTSELQSHLNLVCRLLLEKKKNNNNNHIATCVL